MRGRLRWSSRVLVGGVVVLAAALGACGDDDADSGPATSSTVPVGVSSTELASEVTTIAGAVTSSIAAGDDATVEVTTTTVEPGGNGDPVVPEGFDAVTITITAADGSVEEFCVWLARTMQQQQRGLMEVTDLGGAAGMLFVYDDEVTHRFWMHNTPMPLSIAFFDGGGELVWSTDMEPCIDRPTADCPRYASPAAYQFALEVPQGELPLLGVGEGATIDVAATGDDGRDGAACEPL